MFKKLFGLGSKTNEETIVAPLSGAVKNIEEVPDPVFAGRMMGDGVAIDPTEGEENSEGSIDFPSIIVDATLDDAVVVDCIIDVY